MNSQSSSWVQFFASFTKQIDGTTTDDFEDLDLLLPMYHSLEYNSNFLTRQVVHGFIPKI